MSKKIRHILSISGGKDSTALAIYMRDKVPDMEYIFCDTGEELPETYEYLIRIETFLGKPIKRLNPTAPFYHWYKVFNGHLPSPKARWCTKLLKIKPFEEEVGNNSIFSYIGIRADENREGYISHKPNIEPIYPFKEAGITKADVYKILEDSGIGIPEYYKWRSRSGCYFCFFQRIKEWAGLFKYHPDLFEKAKTFERCENAKFSKFTWTGKSLDEIAQKYINGEIKTLDMENNDSANKNKKKLINNSFFMDDDNEEEKACLICSL